MKAGSKTYLFLGIVGFFVFLTRLALLLSGQGNLLDIFAAIFFILLSTWGFVSYFRVKGKASYY